MFMWANIWTMGEIELNQEYERAALWIKIHTQHFSALTWILYMYVCMSVCMQSPSAAPKAIFIADEVIKNYYNT